MTQQLQGAQYDDFMAIRKRTRKNGLAMMPTAGPSPQPAVVVSLHGGLEYDIISFVAGKRGEPPTVPAPATTNPNRVFLEGWQSAIFPIQDMGGIERYAIAGYYIFGILSPEGLESDFMLGNLPFPGVDTNEVFYAGKYLSYQLLNQAIVPILQGQQQEILPQLLRQISNQG